MTKGKKIISYAILIIASIFSVFPLYWMVVSATNKSTEVVGGRLIPGTYLLENWASLMKAQKVGEAMLILAKTRPKFVGGPRAQYNLDEPAHK